MKTKSILTFLFLIVLSISAKASKLEIIQDTLMYDSVPTGQNSFDTVIVKNNATLTLTHADSAGGAFGKYNLQAHKLFLVEPGSKAIGLPGMEGYLAVNKGRIVNLAGNDSIENISINMYGSDTISGHPSSFMNVIAGWRDRNLIIDTTTTFNGTVFEGHKNTIYLWGDTLILGDSAKITPYNPSMDGGDISMPEFAHINFEQGGVLKRRVSINDVGIADTLPLGFNSTAGAANLVITKLNPGVSFGPDPYILYELIPDYNPNYPKTNDTLNFYLKISGNDIFNLNYDVSLRFTSDNVTGNTSNMLSAFYNGTSWVLQDSLDAVNGYINLSGLENWGEVTTIGKPMPSSVAPANGSTDIKIDSVISVVFDMTVDSVDFLGITIKNSSDVEVGGIVMTWDNGLNTITIDHDSLAFNENYTVTIPDSVVSTSEGAHNNSYSWTFKTLLNVSINKTLNESIIISPVPADNYLNIEGENITSIKIYSINGTLVKVLNPDLKKSDISSINSGIYIIEVETIGGSHKDKIIIE
jgi:hypothetical protein